MFSYRNTYFLENKELRSALQLMRGVGFYKSCFICAKIGFSFPFSVSKLNLYYFTLLSFFFRRLVVTTDRANRLKKKRMKLLLSLKSWKALRHKDFLPVNGQRTRSNAGVRRREKVFILLAREAEAKRKAELEKKKKLGSNTK